jgi:germination protein M
MLKKMSIRKITLTSLALFAMMLIYFMPSNKLNVEKQLEYVSTDLESCPIFLMDKNSYVALTDVAVSDANIEKKAQDLIKILTIGGMDSKIPSGFSAIIPPNTEVLSLNYEKGLIKVNFSKDILSVPKRLEEKMIEAIVYTLTSIDKVDKVIIYVEGDILTKLPKTKINLPSTLDRSFGINKEFDLTSTKDITDVTIYYINQINDHYYYVPVTKYVNDARDKSEIIIDELEGITNKNLQSFVNNDVKLVSANIKDNTMYLNFNDKIAEDTTSQKIVKETLNTIAYSIKDNYNVQEVSFNVSGKEIAKVKNNVR